MVLENLDFEYLNHGTNVYLLVAQNKTNDAPAKEKYTFFEEEKKCCDLKKKCFSASYSSYHLIKVTLPQLAMVWCEDAINCAHDVL